MSPTPTMGWQIKVLYDGDCPLCMREIRFLEKRAGASGLAAFEDIAAPTFDASVYGVDHATLMARIHGVLPDGSLVEGVEVFRRVYAAVGLGWLVAPTRWPGIEQLADLAYQVFARNRLRWTGRGAACTADQCSPVEPPRSASG